MALTSTNFGSVSDSTLVKKAADHVSRAVRSSGSTSRAVIIRDIASSAASYSRNSKFGGTFIDGREYTNAVEEIKKVAGGKTHEIDSGAIFHADSGTNSGQFFKRVASDMEEFLKQSSKRANRDEIPINNGYYQNLFIGQDIFRNEQPIIAEAKAEDKTLGQGLLKDTTPLLSEKTAEIKPQEPQRELGPQLDSRELNPQQQADLAANLQVQRDAQNIELQQGKELSAKLEQQQLRQGEKEIATPGQEQAQNLQKPLELASDKKPEDGVKLTKDTAPEPEKGDKPKGELKELSEGNKQFVDLMKDFDKGKLAQLQGKMVDGDKAVPSVSASQAAAPQVSQSQGAALA